MSEYPSYLIHYGITGQKWGVRRFQNEDGTYTSEGLERRRQLIESGASKAEIRKATREGNREVRYNKMMAKAQNAANRRFDKHTSQLMKDKKAGLNPSEKNIKKAIKLGTDVRTFDYIAKDPKTYYNNMRKTEKGATISAILGGVYGLPVAGIIGGVNAYKTNKYYANVIDKARNETIEDLKKHKLI
ncbi:MAG: hypothetical protein IJ880_13710 [Bacilli bacterium]|nr:hypothetical protein [Bacilli bacterium]